MSGTLALFNVAAMAAVFGRDASEVIYYILLNLSTGHLV
jgi:hypothetical protein